MQTELHDDLLAMIAESPTPWHAISSAIDRLSARGYRELRIDERWTLAVGDRRFLRLGGGALVAFDLADAALSTAGCVVLAAHTDSPALRAKEQGAAWKKGYLVLPTEIYGGPIRSSWVDRELGVGGRAVVAGDREVVFTLPERVIIPNAAIHLNRKVNEGFEYNPQDHLVALLAADHARVDGNARDELRELVCRAAGEEVVEFEALLYDPAPGAVIGSGGSLLVAPRLDNLAGCFTCTEAFLADSAQPRMLALFNHEEIGSLTGEGARSPVLHEILVRITRALGGDGEDAAVAEARSIIVSNDAAHALLPSYADRHDPDYAPVLGGGPVLKSNAGYSYATTAPMAARFRSACERAQVRMQRLVARSDARSGGTVGPMSWAATGIPTMDVGVPVVAMHSIRETGGTSDAASMVAALRSIVELHREAR